MKYIALLFLTFLSLSSFADIMTKADYIEAVRKARSTYPIDQGNGTEVTDSYMNGDTNIIVTRFKNFGKDYFKQDIIVDMETYMSDSVSSTYCTDSGLQSQIRLAGVDIEYHYVDKNGDKFWSYTVSEKACREIRSKSEIKKLQAIIDSAKQQINKLLVAGKGEVTMCRLGDIFSTVAVGFTTELDQPHIFLRAVGQYAVNMVHLYLNKPQLKMLSQIIDKASADAVAIKDIEKVELASFSTNGGTIHFISRFGKISAFFSLDNGVDRVLTHPEISQLKFCLDESEKLL